ncbi:alpha/beta hydrolase [Patescibacteria group bacterium]|nr:alpha/beta hydrolase [Patescibacteria group bacterium]
MKYVIIHGAFGSKDGNWFPWLKKNLDELGHSVILEQYPVDDFDEITKKGKNNSDNTIQNLKSWLNLFQNKILPNIKKDEPLVFIGHSLAPLFILHLLNKFSIKLNAGIFVSPFMSEIGGQYWQFDFVNKSFYKTNFNWKKLKELMPYSYVIYGEKDPYVKSVYPKKFAEKLSSSLIKIPNGGHLGEEYKEFPLMLELCKIVG